MFKLQIQKRLQPRTALSVKRQSPFSHRPGAKHHQHALKLRPLRSCATDSSGNEHPSVKPSTKHSLEHSRHSYQQHQVHLNSVRQSRLNLNTSISDGLTNLFQCHISLSALLHLNLHSKIDRNSLHRKSICPRLTSSCPSLTSGATYSLKFVTSSSNLVLFLTLKV